ncbi:MAG: HD domain-containing protein, partial [Blautia sp.]
MERLQRIWEHPLYQEHYGRIQRLERERRLCRHTLEHFLDVARLTYIYVLEEKIPVAREVVYGAGLLHDIGKDQQYTG